MMETLDKDNNSNNSTTYNPVLLQDKQTTLTGMAQVTTPQNKDTKTKKVPLPQVGVKNNSSSNSKSWKGNGNNSTMKKFN